MAPAARARRVSAPPGGRSDFDLVDAATSGTPDPERVARVRDALFTMQETLDTLGVPHALAGHRAWQAAIGTEQGG